MFKTDTNSLLTLESIAISQILFLSPIDLERQVKDPKAIGQSHKVSTVCGDCRRYKEISSTDYLGTRVLRLDFQRTIREA